MRVDPGWLERFAANGMHPDDTTFVPTKYVTVTYLSELLPIPPSTNNLFASVVRKTKNGKSVVSRIRTSKYNEWIDLATPAAWRIPVAIEYPVAVTLTVEGYLHPLRDVDNIPKSVLDLLVSVGVLKNDSIQYVRSVLVQHDPDSVRSGVRVEIRSIPCEIGTAAANAKGAASPAGDSSA